MILRKAAVIFLFLSSVSARGQILDDTTIQIYGTGTTRYVLEEEILNNRSVIHRPDTSLNDLHNLPFLYGRNVFYQDLGVLGTAINEYVPEIQERPGAVLGYDVYTPYAILPEEIRYYDTRSPFTELFYLQGSRGQQYLKAAFSRNINPRWNFGFDFRILGSRRIIGRDRRAQQARSNSFAVYTRYMTKGETYQVLANFTFFDHKVFETGGIRPLENELPLDSMFDDIEEAVYMRDARSYDKRYNYHLFHQISFFKRGLQLYHIGDYSRRFNRFKNNAEVTSDTLFYNAFGLDFIHTYPGTYNNTVFDLLENELGFKGKLGEMSYRFWYRNRNITYGQDFGEDLSPNQNFIGGRVSWDVSDSARAFAEAELMNGQNDYMAKIELRSKYFNAGVKRIVYEPPFFYQQYFGNFFQWENDTLEKINSSQVYAGSGYRHKRFFADLKGRFNLIDNYVFLNENAVRAQAAPDQQLRVLTLSGEAGINFLNFHLENYFLANFVAGQNNADTLINLPPLVNRTRFYYQNYLLKAALFQIGFDVNYRAGYFADEYMPVTQHYYLNNDFFIPSYAYVDVFVNAQIKQVVGFAKMTFIDEGLFRDGYFITPFYTGMPRTFYFGITWRFYD